MSDPRFIRSIRPDVRASYRLSQTNSAYDISPYTNCPVLVRSLFESHSSSNESTSSYSPPFQLPLSRAYLKHLDIQEQLKDQFQEQTYCKRHPQEAIRMMYAKKQAKHPYEQTMIEDLVNSFSSPSTDSKSNVEKERVDMLNQLRINFDTNRRQSDASSSQVCRSSCHEDMMVIHLDTPDISKDFYTELLDAHPTLYKTCSAAIGSSVYQYKNGNIDKLINGGEEDERISSLSYIQNGTQLLEGRVNGQLTIWDIETRQSVFSTETCSHKICSFGYSPQAIFIVSGSSKGHVQVHDFRFKNKYICSTTTSEGDIHHTQPVTSLSWNASGTKLLSGGNDNTIHVWEPTKRETPLMSVTHHKACIKGLKWSPVSNTLFASGGGTKDMKLCVFDIQRTDSKDPIYEVYTGAQITNLHWHPEGTYLMTSHGYGSKRDSNPHVTLTHECRTILKESAGCLNVWKWMKKDSSEFSSDLPVERIQCSKNQIRALNSRISFDQQHVFVLLPDEEYMSILKNPLASSSYTTVSPPPTSKNKIHPSLNFFDLSGSGMHIR